MSVKQLKQLKPAQYRYTDNKKGETNRLSMGIMAQDIEKIWPYESYSILRKSEDNFYQVVENSFTVFFTHTNII